MGGWNRWVPAAVLLLGGAALVGAAVATSQARVYLLLFVPVVTGASGLFLLGVLLLVAGFVAAFWAVPPEVEPSLPGTHSELAGSEPHRDAAGGGVVLIGPIPIAFGAARPASRRGVYLLLLAAAALFVLVWLALGS